MDSDRLLDHKTILDKFADVLPGVGIGDLIDFIGIKPDLVLAAFHNRISAIVTCIGMSCHDDQRFGH